MEFPHCYPQNRFNDPGKVIPMQIDSLAFFHGQLKNDGLHKAIWKDISKTI